MKRQSSKPRVGIFGLTGCAGDQLQILNCEDRLLGLGVALDGISTYEIQSCPLESVVPRASLAQSGPARGKSRRANQGDLGSAVHP